MPKISICMNTARGDYPMTAYPDLHQFEFFMRSLRTQTFKDFEVVICDVEYQGRADYFEKHPENFRIKHVPVKPNIWTPKGYVAICTTKNTCLLHAEGEIVVFTDDCSMFEPDYLQNILAKITPEIGISNRFSNNWGDISVHKDIRKEGFIENVWGNIALYMDVFLKANGYNEFFDGSRGLEDCEFSARVRKLGIQWYLLNQSAQYQVHGNDSRSLYPTLIRHLGPRCCRLAEVLAFGPTRKDIIRANEVPLTDEEVKTFQQCNDKKGDYTCPYTKGKCSWINVVTDAEKLDIRLYQHPSLMFNLTEQRKDIPGTLKYLQAIV